MRNITPKEFSHFILSVIEQEEYPSNDGTVSAKDIASTFSVITNIVSRTIIWMEEEQELSKCPIDHSKFQEYHLLEGNNNEG